MSTTSWVVPDILISGGPSNDAWSGLVYDLGFSYVDGESYTLMCFCMEAKACLKLFCGVGNNGTVISILEVYNGSLCHFCFGLETTQVEKSPVEPVVNINSRRKMVTDKKEYGT